MMLKPCDNPPITFPEGAAIERLEGTWWVAHTRSRQEKAFARDLVRKGIRYFLPMVEKTTIVRGRRFEVPVCLFSSYVFVCGSEEERVEALKGNRLAGSIRVGDQETLRKELSDIQRALSAKAVLKLRPHLAAGKRCRVTSGPFAGIEGVVQRLRNATQVVLNVQSLGQAVALEVDAALLEPADS